jgi:hypothetical protein
MTWKVGQRLQYGSVGLRVFWVLVDGNGDLAVERAFVTKEDALAYANGESGWALRDPTLKDTETFELRMRTNDPSAPRADVDALRTSKS